MDVKCPKCGHVFDALENPKPIDMVQKADIQVPQSAPLISLSSVSSPSGYNQNVVSYNPSDSSTALSFSNKISSYRSFTHVQKKGSDEILSAIKKHDGATWGQLEDDTKLSTATISKRLREGKKLGIIREELKDGKKVYRI